MNLIKTKLLGLILESLLAFTASPSMALIMVETVTKEQSLKEFDATVRTETVGTNQVGVWLEFTPKGKLKTFSSVQLEITSGERRIVSVNVTPLKQTSEKVVVYFSTDPAYLATSSFTVFYKSDGIPPYDAVRFNLGDFLTENTHR